MFNNLVVFFVVVVVLNSPILVDDTSFEINALGCMPGPYIKWFVDKIGPEGLYKMTKAFEDKSATAQCIFGYCEPNKEPILFIGRCPVSFFFYCFFFICLFIFIVVNLFVEMKNL
jgi:inosine/xanthosine triphosphate pyrophosphatase family protein